MIVNVRGRNLTIDDMLAKKYALLGQVPIDEDFILYELAVFFEDQDETTLAQKLPQKELTDFIHACLRDYLEVLGGMDGLSEFPELDAAKENVYRVLREDIL